MLSFCPFSFSVNVGHNSQSIALHLNPRFNAFGDTNAIVCNSYQQGKWQQEVRPGGFCFFRGENFKVWITMCSCCDAIPRSPPYHVISVCSSSSLSWPLWGLWWPYRMAVRSVSPTASVQGNTTTSALMATSASRALRSTKLPLCNITFYIRWKTVFFPLILS